MRKKSETVSKNTSTGNEPDSVSQKVLLKILEETKKNHLNYEDNRDWEITSGSLLLDDAMGGGIYPSIIRLAGPNNEGKTPQALEICRNFLGSVENSKVLWCLAEGRGLTKENRSRCGLKFVKRAEEWAVGTVFVYENNIYEDFIKAVNDLVRSQDGTRICFVVDSLDGMITENDAKKAISEQSKIAGVPLLSKRMLQQIGGLIPKYGHLMILISQSSANIQVQGAHGADRRTSSFSGGNSLLHASEFILEFQPSFDSDFILDENDVNPQNKGKTKSIKNTKALGKYCNVRFYKSAAEKSRKRIIRYPVKYGRKPSGIWLEREIIEMMRAWGAITISGAWISFSEEVIEELTSEGLSVEPKHQGMANLCAYLEGYPELTQYLFERFRKLNSQES